jgi:glycosyltransferase involved in cell wall biosynthesis
MTEPLISVIIPSYNYGHFVCDAVRSALAQTYSHAEVIVVDDGSTDDTRERLAQFGDRIHYYYQENQGLSAARNTGIQLARGDFVAFLDSDDAWHPQKLEIQMRCLVRYPDVRLIGSRKRTDSPAEWPLFDTGAEPPKRDVTLKDLIIRGRFSPSSVLLDKSCLDSLTPFHTDLRSAEDRDLWIRIAARFRIITIDLPLVYYRVHGSSMSRAAARMEHFERMVLARAFASIPALRQRWLLRNKAFSTASFSAAWRYREAGMTGDAIRLIVRSLLQWPFPYGRTDTRMSFARAKFLLFTLAGATRRLPVVRKQPSDCCASS